jgi:transcriptional regulator with XRE-family HTH domain
VWVLLDRLDTSQNQLARLAGISPSHLSYLMNEERSPSPRVRRKLQKALGVDDFHQLFLIVPVDDHWNDGGGEGTTSP